MLHAQRGGSDRFRLDEIVRIEDSIHKLVVGKWGPHPKALDDEALCYPPDLLDGREVGRVRRPSLQQRHVLALEPQTSRPRRVAPCSVLLEDRVVVDPCEKFDNPVTLKELNVASRVESLGHKTRSVFLFPTIPAHTMIENGNLSFSMDTCSPLFVHHMTGQSGDVEKRDSSVKSVRDQSSS